MPVIVATMEGAAAPAVNLTVPIRVDAHAAHDWDGRISRSLKTAHPQSPRHPHQRLRFDRFPVA
jgi:hypothetical protein